MTKKDYQMLVKAYGSVLKEFNDSATVRAVLYIYMDRLVPLLAADNAMFNPVTFKAALGKEEK